MQINMNSNPKQRNFVTETINCRPGTEEVYARAGTTSNLRVQAERAGSADVLIAAGWSPSRIGMALLRLHTEWDAAGKPRKPGKTAIEVLALTLPLSRGRPDVVRAAVLANGWYLHELHEVVGRLKMLPDVRRELVLQAEKWGIEDSADVAPAAIMYWLDQTCRTCSGLKWMLIPGAPALSNRHCRACHGSGVASVPHGQAGRRLCNFLDDCVSRAQQSLRNRLQRMN